MDPVVHFELPAEDRARAGAFYTAAFGWEVELLGPEVGNYALATTTATEAGRPTRPGEINGGIYTREHSGQAQTPRVVIAVEDVEDAIARIVTAGGVVEEEIQEIPGVGRYAWFIDTEGNRMSILEPAPRDS